MRKLLLICLLGLSTLCVNAQESRYSIDTIAIHFPLDKWDYDPLYMGNKVGMEKLQSLTDIRSISYRVTSSPEGTRTYNESLSQRRAKSLSEYFLANNINLYGLTEIIAVDEAWDELRQMVLECQMPWRNDILYILDNYPQIAQDENGQSIEPRKRQLMTYQNGVVWRYMVSNWFPSLRRFSVIAKTERPLPVTERVAFHAPSVKLHAPDLARIIYPASTPSQPEAPVWERNLIVKTNFIGLGMGLINVAAELDIAPHWSVALPFYYSGGYDYFKSTIKFRGIVLQPEIRYYIRNNDGFYAGLHLGMGWYNYALGGEFRIQDHRGLRPAMGGYNSWLFS